MIVISTVFRICIIDKNLSFDLHIKYTQKLIKKYIKALDVCVSYTFKRSIFSSFATSYLNYSLTIWGKKDINFLTDLQNKIIKSIE